MSPRLSSHEGGGGWPGGVGGIPPGPLGGASIFGDGSYSSNIIQGGSVLQPGSSGVITITGAATIEPNAATLVAFAMGRHLVLDGEAATLLPSTCCRAMFLGFKSVSLLNGAKLSMTGMGLPGQVTDIWTLYDLIPVAHRSKFSGALRAHVLNPVGASGGLGHLGAAADTGSSGAGKTGGGGGGGCDDYSPGSQPKGGDGAGGTCFCGGSGGGGSGCFTGGAVPGGGNASPYGTAGGNGETNGHPYGTGGGAGRPAGVLGGGGNPGAANGGLGAGGLLVVVAQLVTGSASTIESKGMGGGSSSTTGYSGAGGGSGGGLVYALSQTDTFTGTITCAGGLYGTPGGTRSALAGDGGVGSIIRQSGLS